MGDKKILVVDDEAAILDFLESLLVEEGYEVKTTTGHAALNLAQIYRPDLILLDVMMPSVNGLEVSEALKANRGTRDIPVILMSASKGLIEALKSSHQVEGTLEKPFTIEYVLERINQLFDK
ncbi:MAG TPA: response regulator [Chloroflexia bacterium]|nr:response regulator [Chloroflexia bacterium]